MAGAAGAGRALSPMNDHEARCRFGLEGSTCQTIEHRGLGGSFYLEPAVVLRPAYRRLGTKLEHRQQGQPAAVIATAWKAQQRLHRLWRQFDKRSKRKTIAAVAVARHLAGFCWAITTHTDPTT